MHILGAVLPLNVHGGRLPSPENGGTKPQPIPPQPRNRRRRRRKRANHRLREAAPVQDPIEHGEDGGAGVANPVLFHVGLLQGGGEAGQRQQEEEEEEGDHGRR